MATNFFLIGYHFEEFRNQVSIRKKKLISRPALWPAHHCDLQSLQWWKPQKLHRSPFKWTTKSLLWYPFQCIECKATSITAGEFYGAVIPSNLDIPVNSIENRGSCLCPDPHIVDLQSVSKLVDMLCLKSFIYVKNNTLVSTTLYK